VVQADKEGQAITLVIHSDGKTVSYLAMPPADAAAERPVEQK
jgi:hypothetical protein